MRDLNGLVAAITGVSAGIGQACARALVAEGMKVAGGARRADRLTARSPTSSGTLSCRSRIDEDRPDGGARLVEAAVDALESWMS